MPEGVAQNHVIVENSGEAVVWQAARWWRAGQQTGVRHMAVAVRVLRTVWVHSELDHAPVREARGMFAALCCGGTRQRAQ